MLFFYRKEKNFYSHTCNGFTADYPVTCRVLCGPPRFSSGCSVSVLAPRCPSVAAEFHMCTYPVHPYRSPTRADLTWDSECAAKREEVFVARACRARRVTQLCAGGSELRAPGPGVHSQLTPKTQAEKKRRKLFLKKGHPASLHHHHQRSPPFAPSYPTHAARRAAISRGSPDEGKQRWSGNFSRGI